MTLLTALLVLHVGVTLDAQNLRSATAQIAKAKQADPDAFRTVASVKAPAVEQLGARALWPALELIAFDGAVDESTRVELLDAVGGLLDRRAIPVLEAVLRSDGQSFVVYRAAAKALARMSDEATTMELITLSRGDGMKQDAILAGMGASTRPAVAHELVSVLEAHPAPARATSVIDGIASLRPSCASKDDEVQLRDAAAQALVAAYVRYDGEVRQAAGEALAAVDAPHTELLIANEKLRGVAVPELKQLEQRFTKTPAH